MKSNIHYSSERDYEETGSEGEQQEELDGEEQEREEDDGERVEEEQERDEDQEMMESHQRNHIGKVILELNYCLPGENQFANIKYHNNWYQIH